MKIELDLTAITVAEDERLIMVFPSHSVPPWRDTGPDWIEELVNQFRALGIGDRVLVICADGVQMAKVKE